MKNEMANKVSEKAHNEAIRWHVRLGDNMASEADWIAFTDWLGAEDQNRQAYDSVEDMVIDLAEIQQVKTEPAVVTKANKVVDARSRWGNIRTWSAAAAAIAATIIMVIGGRNFMTDGYSVQEYATAKGEQRLITLADGSTVQLNTNSKIKVMFEDKIRKTELAYGQAIFKVTKNTDRPFLVSLGDSQVYVVGTVFDILRHKNEITVTVSEGVVKVAPIKKSSLQKSARLLPGSQLVHKEGTADINITDVNPSIVMAWEKGYLEYDEVRLADVIEDLNRYFPIPIRVVGLAKDKRFSGIIRTADEQDALLILSEGLPVYVEKGRDEMLVLPNAN